MSNHKSKMPTPIEKTDTINPPYPPGDLVNCTIQGNLTRCAVWLAWLEKIAPIISALIVFMILSPARHFDFLNFDDPLYITQNSHVVSGVTRDAFLNAWTDTSTGHWHPLTWLSHQLDVTLFGVNPQAHHTVALALYASLVSLITLWFLLMRGHPVYAILCTLLFALHPARLESVIWLSERKDLLSMLFGVLSLIAYTRYRQNSARVAYLAAFVSLALGLLAKPSLVVLPVCFYLLDRFTTYHTPEDDLVSHPSVSRKPPHLITYLPFFFLSAALSVTAFFAQHNAHALQSLDTFSLGDRLTDAGVGYLIYLGKTLWPFGLSIFHPHVSYPPGLGVGAWFALLLTSSVAWKKRTTHPLIAFAWVWFIVTLLPVIGFIQIGAQSMADRWSLIPHLGLATALAMHLTRTSYLSHATQKKPYITILRPSLLLLFICLFAYRTYTELPHWKNSIAIFSHALDVTPNNFLAHTNLGAALAKTGDSRSARIHAEEAVRLNPTYPEALNNLGKLEAQAGYFDRARDLFERSLKRDPNNIITRYNLGLLLYQHGNKTAALSNWILVYQMNSNYAPVLTSLTYMMKNDLAFLCQERVLTSSLLQTLRNHHEQTLPNQQTVEACILTRSISE